MSPHPNSQSSSQDLQAIEALVKTYFDGLYEGDADKLGSIFHPTSNLAQSIDGEIVVTPCAQWLAAVRTRGSAKSQGSRPRRPHPRH